MDHKLQITQNWNNFKNKLYVIGKDKSKKEGIVAASDKKMSRLFFGMEVSAPWPLKFPPGRLLEERNRHLTVAFLGNTAVAQLLEHLKNFPSPGFEIGWVGKFDACLSLPEKHPNVVAWHVQWLENAGAFTEFRADFCAWLKQLGYMEGEKKSDLLHVTLCRKPFQFSDWLQAFHELPLMVTHLNLYESLGNSQYEVRWQYPLLPPFIEIEHTADLAFHIYGVNFPQLYSHAVIALAFKCPALLSYLSSQVKIANIDDVIIQLNKLIAKVDGEIGSPFKAISYHDLIVEEGNKLKWEMIVDV